MPNFNRSDFLLCDLKPEKLESLEVIQFGRFYFQSTEPYSYAKNKSTCIVIGPIYSSSQPTWAREGIARDISSVDSLTDLIEKIHHLTGRFVILFSTEENTFVIGDPMGQFEIYFNDDCSVIASSLDLIGTCVNIEEHDDDWAQLYQRIARTTQIQIGKTTKYKGVEHLMPNHLIDFKAKNQVRFYPRKEDFGVKLSLKEGANIVTEELRGFAKSIEKTPNLAMPVTGGNDSRILLGAFQDLTFQTFVFDHPDSDRAKKDIKLAQKVLKSQNRKLKIIKYENDLDSEGDSFFSKPESNPRNESKIFIWNAYKKYLDNFTILYGHGGEIGRSFFKDIKKVNAQKLAVIMGYTGNPLVEREMQKWLDELEPFIVESENLMDLFYWEQRMGNWGARILTEVSYVTTIFSPMNARSVLETMLKVPKKHRQFAGNDLVTEILKILDKTLLKYPINPTLKYRIFLCMIRFHLYDLYQNIRLNFIVYRSRRKS